VTLNDLERRNGSWRALSLLYLSPLYSILDYIGLWWWWWWQRSKVSNKLRNVTETVCCQERYNIIKVLNCLIVNVYLPCVGTADRLLICIDIFADIQSWCDKYSSCDVIAAGDFNCDLSRSDAVVDRVSSFIDANSLMRCDRLFPSNTPATYVNHALNHQSYIDYVLTSNPASVSHFFVLDPELNFSDHLPLFFSLQLKKDGGITRPNFSSPVNIRQAVEYRLRWDKANLSAYYAHSNLNLCCDLLHDINEKLELCKCTNDKNVLQLIALKIF